MARGAAAAAACGIALLAAGCGTARVGPDPGPRLASGPVALAATVHRSLPQDVAIAKATYRNEIDGPKLHRDLRRIAGDQILLRALASGNLAAAATEANAQLRSQLNHAAHVTRISVVRNSRVLFNATVNKDGVFVIPPARERLRSHGRALGTLLVSIQDVTGFLKLTHDRTGAQAIARGAGGQVRSTLPAAERTRLPSSGHATIAGKRYLVRSFRILGWGGEAITVWILAPG